MLYNFNKHVIFHVFWPRNAGNNKKEALESMQSMSLYDKVFPLFDKTIRDIIEREGANSPFPNTEE